MVGLRIASCYLSSFCPFVRFFSRFPPCFELRIFKYSVNTPSIGFLAGPIIRIILLVALELQYPSHDKLAHIGWKP